MELGGGVPGTEALGVHGALDDIFPVEALHDLDRDWGVRHRLVVHPREAHTSLNLINQYTQQTADWVVEPTAGRAGRYRGSPPGRPAPTAGRPAGRDAAHG
ncbi:hypothetical protein HS041_29835 [Planomonospora sp. ID67723]|uniref:hypothetical protein n=1 Tax=Planomonospora sp. ID67723 TaxID=2738134 RepID=UPI0018C357A5|nr:hypothetical protein [Planomonospora sp. ID67723]MBG0831914.1 hypothetical protein [Planomonospora sp. ID67723]